MAKRNEYSEETKAAVMAALLTGQSVSSLSREYGIPKGTVSGWKNRDINRAARYSARIKKKQAEMAALVDSKMDNKKWGVEFFGKSKTEKHVYFVKDSLLGCVKIGNAKHLGARLSSMQAGCPQELSIIGYIKTNSARQLESAIHARFADKNYRREWYTLSIRDIQDVLYKYGGVMVSEVESDGEGD